MKEHKKLLWIILGAVGLIVLAAPLVYAILRVDRIPGLVINREKEAQK